MLSDSTSLYEALVRRDTQYDGIFFAGIRTTGIFCRPTCRARKPKPENVEFFSTAREAIESGYRPCKLCNPLGASGEIPSWLRPVVGELEEGGALRLTDRDLRERGIEPSRVRRWFRKNLGMTFQAYMRGIRIGSALRKLRFGDSVIQAAFDSGYESLSGFSDAFKKATSVSPGRGGEKSTVTLATLPTPVGPMLAGAVDEGVCLLEFTDRRMLKTQLLSLERRLSAVYVPGTHPHLDALGRELEEYFRGVRRRFDVPLVTPGTPFQERVWQALLKIPYGRTATYKEQATALGNPSGTRAVAKANGDNRIAIVIPCHRVIGTDGSLTGYGGGLSRKRYLLDLEAGRL